MRLVIAFAIVGTVVWLFVATRGKDCHYNAHLKNRVVCAKPDR